MSQDIFDFWSELQPSDKIHPRDQYVLDRVDHGFDLRCLPGCFCGPLRTAPVVLLYLSPGFSETDVGEADDPKAQARHAECRKGYQPLLGPDQHEPAWRWLLARTKAFGAWPEVREKIAILNICGYHSKTFSNDAVLAALPSCRVTLDWAQKVLFPEAEEGKRVVICMRSAPYWGLRKRRRYGKGLFAPAVNRAGFMLRQGDDNGLFNDLVGMARELLKGADTSA